jgi:hypothetical protein
MSAVSAEPGRPHCSVAAAEPNGGQASGIADALIAAGDEVTACARLDDLATRLDRVIEAAGRSWAPEVFDRIHAQESAELRCGIGR